MCSEQELLADSGYAAQSNNFGTLMRILDGELRLITPTDGADDGEPTRCAGIPALAPCSVGVLATTVASGVVEQGADAPRSPASAPRYYQLTHDYLVHSLRDWLTRKQRQSRGGRAELRLAERSAAWNSKPENRHLPSWYENLSIRLLTDRRKWTGPQRRMMGQAARTHGLRSLIVAALLIAAVAAGVSVRNAVVRERDRIAAANLEEQNQTRAEGLVAGLTSADVAQVPAIVKEIDGYRTWTDPLLRETFEQAAAGSREKLHAALALLPVDEALIEYVTSQLLIAEPDEFAVIRNALADRFSTIEGRLWTAAGDGQADPAARFRAACALATYAPNDPRWEQVDVWVADELTKVSSVFLRNWMDALRPVKRQLLPRLGTIYRDAGRSEAERSLATDVLADYAADQVTTLAELARDANPRQFASLYPRLARHGPEAITLLKVIVERSLSPDWHDAPLDAAWLQASGESPYRSHHAPRDASITRSVMSTVEVADGLLAERFALCQTMPLETFITVAEALRAGGYRPVRFRPYAAGAEVRVAAVWARDGLEFRLDQGLTAEEIEKREVEMRTAGFVAADLAGYATPGAAPQERYAVVWVRRASDDDDARLFLAQTDLNSPANIESHAGGYRFTSMQQFLAGDGQLRFNFIRRKQPAETTASFAQTPAAFAAQASAGQPLDDVSLSAAPAPAGGQQRYTQMLAQAGQALAANPQNAQALAQRAIARYGLRQDAEAIEDLTGVLARNPQDAGAHQYRAIAYARLGNQAAAAADVAEHGRLTAGADPSQAAYLDAVVAAWSGDPAGLDRLRAALVGHEQDANWLYNSACALAIVSVALGAEHVDLKDRCAAEAADLLHRAVAAGYTNFEAIQGDLDLEAIRDRDEFRQVLAMGQLDLSLAGVWEKDSKWESAPVLGLDPVAHLAKCQELTAAGFRPVAISVESQYEIKNQKPKIVTASVWRRPMIADAARDAQVQGKASAAVALLRLGADDQVWPLLRHDPDPRVRSYLIHALGPLGCDPRVLVGRIEEEANASVRAALVLALGEFSVEQISAAERGPLIVRLLALYEKDLDAGMHGAAEWLLRQWGAGEQIGAFTKALSENEAQRQAVARNSFRGVPAVPAGARAATEARRWYVTKRGRTMVVFEADEFQMGSPASEAGHLPLESPRHTRRLPRRFALAAQEVTHADYAAFQQTRPETLVQGIEVYVKTDDSPQIAVTWYEAAAYCNWLSEQEGLPREQWCYKPNAQGQYAAGMKAKSNAAHLTGYRLPSEAEWEYACRAGTLTSRYYGSTEALLGKYAWYNSNGENRTWPVAILKPNEAGLFDMLGNVLEWCHDAYGNYSGGPSGSVIDTLDAAPLVDNRQRVLRGGAFGRFPPNVRSADRCTYAPTNRSPITGFRVARTYP
ncbi:MAG TPA: SUMF1/EgtB/PvdO family nonheme iron enzyme [Pirellulales bacterium]|nr:SUMF1/EgtB/PvdO family nonheme iron enzyme [Pirellulales bacterium]